MTNNDVLRSIRYMLNVSDAKLIEIAGLDGCTIRPADIVSYLLREEEEGYRLCGHEVMAHFLNGLVFYKRGKDESRSAPILETPVTNNVVLKKLRVAFELKDTDIVTKIEKNGMKVSKTELSAFFRNPDHRNYRECGDQFLRNLLKGLTP